MKVFISWSGNISKALAEVLKKWLPVVINSVKPYYSSEDIAKGSRWFNEISNELSDTRIGIICLTNENLDSSWIMFEAGALSVNVEKSKVCPICFNVDPTNIKGPLTNFQAVKFSKEDFKRLIVTINKELAEFSIDIQVLDKAFEAIWPQIELEVKAILQNIQTEPHSKNERSEKDILLELLERTRELPFIQNDTQIYEKQNNQIFESLLLSKIESLQKEISTFRNNSSTRDVIYSQHISDARINQIKQILFEKLIPFLKEQNKSYEDFLKDSTSLDKVFNSIAKRNSLKYQEFLKHIASFDNKDIAYAIGNS